MQPWIITTQCFRSMEGRSLIWLAFSCSISNTSPDLSTALVSVLDCGWLSGWHLIGSDPGNGPPWEGPSNDEAQAKWSCSLPPAAGWWRVPVRYNSFIFMFTFVTYVLVMLIVCQIWNNHFENKIKPILRLKHANKQNEFMITGLCMHCGKHKFEPVLC